MKTFHKYLFIVQERIVSTLYLSGLLGKAAFCLVMTNCTCMMLSQVITFPKSLKLEKIIVAVGLLLRLSLNLSNQWRYTKEPDSANSFFKNKIVIPVNSFYLKKRGMFERSEVLKHLFCLYRKQEWILREVTKSSRPSKAIYFKSTYTLNARTH